ncbi:MAG: methyltransferase domain-containing protein [Anaerolineae bacterium]|nr:methyltransferase domain-containing protein [Anaerolineae bacterium]
MTGTDTYLQRLVESNPLREPLLRTVVQALGLLTGSRGLDAGCGIGLQALLLAEAVGPAGHVTGLDLSPAFLRYGEKLVAERGLSECISFREGNVRQLPFDDDTFDWVWSADCVGYPVGDLLSVLLELKRVVKPGGTIAILAWSSQSLLPGYPLLEARLNATGSGLAPHVRGKPPESHFLRALGWFERAGLVELEARTFVGGVQAPLSDGVRTALISLFEMLWGEPVPEVSPEDWAEYQRLCRPESPDLILDLPDYVAFYTYSLFRGTVPS